MAHGVFCGGGGGAEFAVTPLTELYRHMPVDIGSQNAGHSPLNVKRCYQWIRNGLRKDKKMWRRSPVESDTKVDTLDEENEEEYITS